MNSNDNKYLDFWKEKTHHFDPIKLEMNNVLLKIPAGVFNPSVELTYSTKILLDNMPKDLSGKRVLDMGTGSGILALSSELRGSSSITAIDIDRNALKAATENFYLNNCSKISFIWSDLFNNIITSKNDYIFANLPILNVDCDDLYGRLLNYYENYLFDNGELWLVFASFGNMDFANKYFQNHPNLIEKIKYSHFNVDWLLYKLKK